MLESLIHIATQSAEAGHTPQTAIAALLCAALVNFFS
ncbi:TPA: YshB family small membrane protein [Cronobacter sakazakii]|nr:YshB family small membrane protein [Cronobacter sakazakii]HAU5515674.1 YshB family small membrane protein [Cronobacter sakazakii]